MKKTVITISREFCSGGRVVGRRVSEALGIPFYDRELITLAAEKSGLAPEYIESSESQMPSSFLYGLAAGQTGAGSYLYHYDLPISDRAFFAQSAAIRELAEKGSCVIVGRCGSFVLREDPSCVKVFIHGSVSDRIKRAVEVYGMEQRGVADKLIKGDRGRARYYKHYTGDGWNDMRCYDLTINTTVFGIDGAVDTILSLVKNR